MNSSIKAFIYTSLIILCCILFYNYKIDNYGVFENRYKSICKNTPLHNESIVKKEFVKNTSGYFSNYMFGNIKATNISTTTFPSADWYSLVDFYQTPYDIIELLEYTINFSEINNIIIFISPEFLYIDKQISNSQKNSYINYKKPTKTKDKIIFYLRYLYKNPFYSEKYILSPEEKINIFKDGSHIGAYENNFFPNIQIETKSEKIEELITEIKKIIDYCKENNITTKIILLPQSNEYLKSFNVSDIQKFKKELQKVHSYYDFWNENKINNNPNNFDKNQRIKTFASDEMMNIVFYKNKSKEYKGKIYE